jgi:hypothetical protein
MPSDDIRCIYLPYCIKRQPNGTYVLLNRDYKPLGFKTHEHIDYGAYPIGVKIRGLTAKAAAKLSHNGSTDLSEIFMYDDSSIPTKSKENMSMYLERLAYLAKFKVD